MSNSNIQYVYDIESSNEVILCEKSLCSYPPHTHASSITFGLILRGQLTLQFHDCIHILHEDETFIIPPNTLHSLHAHEEYSLFSFSIHTSFFEVSSYDSIKQNLQRIIEQAPFSKYIKQTQIHHILKSIQRFHLSQFENVQFPIKEVMSYIDNHLEFNCSIASMSQVIFLSKFHFIRTFKKATDLTPHQYLIQSRIRKAQKLLYTNSLISDVACTTGFYDESHFTRHFKKIVGLTPTTFQHACILLKT